MIYKLFCGNIDLSEQSSIGINACLQKNKEKYFIFFSGQTQMEQSGA